MAAYEVTYKLGKYTNSVIVPAKDGCDAHLAAFPLIPAGAEILSVKELVFN
jgi:hypothetical protein